jgi:predicted AAA+ superfamily ATPase
LEDFNTFGFLFESLCIRDLRVYTQALGGEVFHYRDKSGLEADAIVHLTDGRWGAIEIKMGSKETEEAAENLKTLREKINLSKMREPSFLMVLTGTELAYRRKDGVYIVPMSKRLILSCAYCSAFIISVCLPVFVCFSSSRNFHNPVPYF